MSDVPLHPDTVEEGAFSVRTASALILVGIVAFFAMAVLGAYAPDLRSGRNGGAHAWSNAAVGFSGIVRLADATGRQSRVVRDPRLLDMPVLVVLTPERAATDMTKVLAQRRGKPTLIVLPKWQTQKDRTHAGWVNGVALLPPGEPAGVLAPQYPLRVTRYRGSAQLRVDSSFVGQLGMPAAMRLTAPPALQTIAGPNVGPIVSDAAGHVVLGQIGTQPLYVLADPDLLSNIGMRDAAQAYAALGLLDGLNTAPGDPIVFDVSLNGFGRSPSPLKLAFDPPFLAMTLALAAAAVLAGVQATARFGPPRRQPRAIAFGKVALIDNAAALVRKARRQGGLGARYGDVVRDRAVGVFGVPSRLRDDALDRYLDGLSGRTRFTLLAEDARNARHPREMLAAAQALHQWLWEKTR
jgi:hypothetical protein